MRHLFLALLTLPLLPMALLSHPATAESLACQTVNGKTMCVEGSGTLACQTVNGRTTCTHSPTQTLCDTRNGKVVCPGMPSIGGDVVVDTRNGRVRVRTGNVDVDVNNWDSDD
jgi:hypothetical protein